MTGQPVASYKSELTTCYPDKSIKFQPGIFSNLGKMEYMAMF